MTRAGRAAVEARSREVVTRAVAEESWMDVQALTLEARRELGHAVVAKVTGRDPWPRIFAADRRLNRLNEYARRHAAEAAGITFIAPGQMPLADGCFDGEQGA